MFRKFVGFLRVSSVLPVPLPLQRERPGPRVSQTRGFNRSSVQEEGGQGILDPDVRPYGKIGMSLTPFSFPFTVRSRGSADGDIENTIKVKTVLFFFVWD